MKYIFLLLMSQIAQADDWFCKSQTAQKNGNVMSVCGIGIGLVSEEAARVQAMRMAKLNFQDLCYMSEDCYTKKHISAEPKRTECVATSKFLTTCYQLIEFTIK